MEARVTVPHREVGIFKLTPGRWYGRFDLEKYFVLAAIAENPRPDVFAIELVSRNVYRKAATLFIVAGHVNITVRKIIGRKTPHCKGKASQAKRRSKTQNHTLAQHD